jgi:hypothetical protein
MVRSSHCAIHPAKPDAPALAKFARLLSDRKLEFWMEESLQDVIEIRETRPDFLVRTGASGDILVEVESFEGESKSLSQLRNSNPFASGLSDRDFKRIRSRLDKAAAQLGPYRLDNIPLLIVLDDFREIGIPQNPDVLLLALYGLDGGFAFFRTNDKRFISAVGWLRDTGSGLCLRIIHNRWADVPLSLNAFQKTQDEHWGIDNEGHMFGPL